MPELRWILVAFGIVLIAGLWIWETRRARASPQQDGEGGAQGQPRAEPRLEDEVEARAPRPAVEPSAIRATRAERIGPRNPPVVEIPPDVEPELAPVRRAAPDLPPAVPYREIQDELDALPPDLELAEPPQDEYTRREPWVRTQPLDREAIKRAQEQEDAEALERAAEDPAGSHPAARQRIVALRLVSGRDRWNGRAVVDALEAEGMHFGKYSVFHRAQEDGKSIFYAASMIEPGSFDMQRVDSLSYPGVSLFAVVPGPVEAPIVFDLMLATGRRLADRLQGQLQDEQGSSLTAQRVLNLREELVQLEHVTRRLRGA